MNGHPPAWEVLPSRMWYLPGLMKVTARWSKIACALVVASTVIPLTSVVVGSLTAVTLPACTVAGCDPTTKPDPGVSIPTGNLVDGSVDTWESNPITGTWFDFPGQRTQLFSLENVPDITNRNVEEVIPYLSTDPSPLQDQGNFVVASGNIAEITAVMNTYSDDDAHVRLPFVIVHNDSCGQYFLRVVVRLTPVQGAASGGTPSTVATISDAGANDAAPIEASPSD